MKSLFALDPDLHFLNHGSFGACPWPVLDAQRAWQLEMEKNPVAFLGRHSGRHLWAARQVLAGHLGADPAHLVFLANATHGVNTVARSLDLGPGDEVLASDHEYGACDYTWRHECQRTGARYVRAEIPLPFSSRAFADQVWAAVTPRTRVLFLSHVTSATALVFPLQELCRRARAAGILTVVDGAHVPGHLPLALDALGADLYAGNCHKWLCAPKGSAFLHARPEHHPLLQGLAVSWGYGPEEDAGNAACTGTSILERRQQWQGTRDLSPFLAVPAAIRFQAEHGWDAVRAACHGLAGATRDRIAALTGLEPACQDADFGQMAAIPVPAMDPVSLQTALFERHRIEIPVTTHGGRTFVRMSVQGYNTPADADALVAALRTIYAL